jgi:hypothetical protein
LNVPSATYNFKADDQLQTENTVTIKKASNEVETLP